jgi:F-type H+-transporting ATPase subunit delta
LNGGLPKRYARALADLAIEAGQLEEVGDQLEELSRIFHETPALKSLFFRPADRDYEELALAMERLLEALQIQGLAQKFLLFLLEKGRFSLLFDICRHYQKLVDMRRKRVRVLVSTPLPLSGEELGSLCRSFQKRLEKEVILTQRQDPSLLGGWRAQIGSDEVWDASIQGELGRMKLRLLADGESN